MNINELLAIIEEKRDCGVVHVLVFDRQRDLSWEEAIIEKSKEIPFFSWNSIWFYRKNKKGIEEQPVSIDEVRDKKLFKEITDSASAVAILSQLLHKDMAYGSEIMPLEEARNLASGFISLFDATSNYYSNSTWHQHESGGNIRAWAPLTEATFDSGIIVVDNHKIGIAWFEDED